MIKTLGKVYLNNTQFTSDPKVARGWQPRRARLLGIQGATTQQDWGRWAKDMRLTLTSDGNWINRSFKSYVDGLMLTRRQSYPYRDYTGLEGTVVIVSFDPRPTFIRDGLGVLYEYTMVLDLMSVTKLEFSTYTGS